MVGDDIFLGFVILEETFLLAGLVIGEILVSNGEVVELVVNSGFVEIGAGLIQSLGTVLRIGRFNLDGVELDG